MRDEEGKEEHDPMKGASEAEAGFGFSGGEAQELQPGSSACCWRSGG